MATEVFFEAQQVGDKYRGLVINAKTFDHVLITAHNYTDRTTAVCAAKRMYTDAMLQNVQAHVPSMSMMER